MRTVAVALAMALVAGAARANPPPVPALLRLVVGRATVAVLPAGCTGVLVGSPTLVATARHCIGAPERLRIRVGGVERPAEVVEEDPDADQALLRLIEPLPGAKPLEVVRRLPIVGTVLYFRGRPRGPASRWQAARLDKIGTCPSLPNLSRALFTSIEGVPGDSGAPLVDLLGRVVGLVHGGAQCHIATPGDRLARLVDRALQNPLIAPGQGGSRAS